MPNPRLASRYAKSLLDLSLEQNSVDAVLGDMKMIQEAVKTTPEFKNLLKSPLVKADKKLSILKAVFGNHFNPLTTSFLDLIVKKGREENLFEISQAFNEQYEELKNIQTVQVTSAAPLDEATLQAIIKKVGAELNNSNLIVKTIIDPSIVGGFKLQVGDKFFDASISRDLQDIRNQFTQNSYEAMIGINPFKTTK